MQLDLHFVLMWLSETNRIKNCCSQNFRTTDDCEKTSCALILLHLSGQGFGPLLYIMPIFLPRNSFISAVLLFRPVLFIVLIPLSSVFHCLVPHSLLAAVGAGEL